MRLPCMTDEEIMAAHASDPDVVEIDPHMVAYFKQKDDDFKARINDVLKAYVEDNK